MCWLCLPSPTATVAEQWGRRWITIDTSRVALALARARIMGARYPFYLLADSRDGQLKEAEVTRTAPSSQPVRGNIRHGFVYERVPHITLKSIANNAEIDVIWDKWQAELEPLREKLNTALKKQWQEWEIPREADKAWTETARKLHADWWQARIARQKAIDASIAAKAEFEYLYDKPYDDKKKVRVAGPFTVESLSPHRMLGVDENDELIDTLIDTLKENSPEYGARQSFPQMILDNLKTAGVQQAHKEDRITFTALTPWPGDLVCGEGKYLEGEAPSEPIEKRAAIFIGPEFGTVQRADLVAAAREAGDAGFDVLIACAFNYEAHTTEFTKLGRIPVLKARMNADLHMAEDLGVNLTAAGGDGQWRGILAKDPPGSAQPAPYQAWFNQGNSILGFGRGNGTVSDFAFGAGGAANIPTTGVWQHWAIVMNGTSVTMFRNGTAIAMTDTVISTTIADGGGNLIIGDRPGAQDMSFFGRLDDVAIFDEALTSTQVSTIMSGNFSAFGVIPEPSSAALLLLTGATGLLRRRKSRSSHPGTPPTSR